MEVVSPLTGFARSNQGGKRRFACSPIHDATTATTVTNGLESSDDFDMDDCSSFGFQPSKRRRKQSNEAGGDSNPFLQAADKWSLSPFVHRSPNAAAASKRCRTSQFEFGGGAVGDVTTANRKVEELQLVVDQQAAEINRLKGEKEACKSSLSALSSQHEKAENENKILKKAVTIQQERQNQLNAELEGARHYKAEADERIRRLEQMNLTLQYQLQALNSSAGNDFMRFSPHPPDVY